MKSVGPFVRVEPIATGGVALFVGDVEVRTWPAGDEYVREAVDLAANIRVAIIDEAAEALKTSLLNS